MAFYAGEKEKTFFIIISLLSFPFILVFVFSFPEKNAQLFLCSHPVKKSDSTRQEVEEEETEFLIKYEPATPFSEYKVFFNFLISIFFCASRI